VQIDVDRLGEGTGRRQSIAWTDFAADDGPAYSGRNLIGKRRR
jgi:hypothetical protein